MKNCLGVDIGGTAVKASVFDRQGRELGTAGVVTPVIADEPGKVERDLKRTWEGILQVISDACAAAGVNPSSIDFIAGTGHGKGAYLRFAGEQWPTVGIVSSDNRAARLARDLGSAPGYARDILPRITQPLWPSHSSAMLAWLQREQPDRYRRIDQVLFSKDFITCMLTGRACTDHTAATASGLYRTDTNEVDPEILRYFGLEALEKALPEALPSHEVAGGVRREVADATGLREGTPVVAGLFDVNAAAIASAITADREMSLVAGTWNIATATTTDPGLFRDFWDTLSVQTHCIPGEWMIHEGSPTSAGNLEWWVQHLFNLGGDTSWDTINSHVEAADTTSVLFFPYIFGSPGDPRSTGTLVGLQSGTTTGEVIRAIYEGVTFQLLEHAEPILGVLPGIEQVRLAGGVKRSRPWTQLITDTFNRPLFVSPTEEIGALGAVICGAVGTGEYPDYPEAIKGMTSFHDPLQPDPRQHEALRERYKTFLRVRDTLHDTWEAAHGLVE
jgi:L-xylulokinase